jgi:hypothetical protein
MLQRSLTTRRPTEGRWARRLRRYCMPMLPGGILTEMSIRFEKIWVDQCRATRGIKRRFGVKSALDYLIREKLLNFAQEADRTPEFAKELPRFLAEIWRIFNEYEIAGYVASLKPKPRKTLRNLLYLR